MQLPTVSEGETRNEFTSRCMNNESMIDEFSNEFQRLDKSRDIFEASKTEALSIELDSFLEKTVEETPKEIVEKVKE